jgi:hypothetical protein
MEATKSLAGKSKRTYWMAQVRTDGVGLKVQIKTDKLNRDYGATFYIELENTGFGDIIRQAIFEKQTHSMNVASLYKGSKETYVMCQFRLPHGTNKIQFQVSTGEQYNRPYGLAFAVYQIGLFKSLKAHIKKLGLDGNGQGYKQDKELNQKVKELQKAKGLVWNVEKQKWDKMDDTTSADTPTKADWDSNNVEWNEQYQKWIKGNQAIKDDIEKLSYYSG